MAGCIKELYLALGSNIDNRIENILKAISALRDILEVKKISTIYESPPWGITSQPKFLNCAILCNADLPPFELLKEVKSIEKKLGRIQRERWGPREIDIDILIYGDLILKTPELEIPHPHLSSRDFFILPLIELSESILHPVYKKPLRDFLPKESLCTPFACVLPA
ncbi:MAG: 2-amino-4-hydroxy-6-hydroxymethyldihydropteridine diphosphokinase [Aquificaceae bacterium]|nr:2-amino-4-hydroxy-6-hydroxymethyldihydropteridine diphosphokinase [Aquificaceae bacterium]MDW8236802.1 2-amino-4-hydroxy-6-hydroxymethyldihydropteridine diphosphokinase [Aquificaceae bacterium]